MNTETGLQTLERLNACPTARAWAEQFKGRSAEEAYNACERADWLLWLAIKVDVDRRTVVQACCECARTALPFVPDGELRPLRAIETAEAWVRGEATIEQVRQAAYAAYDAANAAANAAAYDAAYAAAYAAYAAYDAANAAANAAAYAAAYAAYAAYDAAARQKARREMCALIRTRIPFALIAEKVWPQKAGRKSSMRKTQKHQTIDTRNVVDADLIEALDTPESRAADLAREAARLEAEAKRLREAARVCEGDAAEMKGKRATTLRELNGVLAAVVGLPS